MTAPTLAATFAAALADLEQREAALAGAMEQLSQERAVQASYRDGIRHERQRILLLIAAQIDTLTRSGNNHLILTALQRQITDPDATP